MDNIEDAKRKFRSIVTTVRRESIYTKFKIKCEKEHRSIKSVLIELMTKYVYGE